LLENKDKLTKLADTLLEKEVIFREDLEEIFGKRPFGEDESNIEGIKGDYNAAKIEEEAAAREYDKKEKEEKEAKEKAAKEAAEKLNGHVSASDKTAINNPPPTEEKENKE